MDSKSIVQSSSSSSSSSTKRKYDVFVSFRGEDTRNNYTDHLFAALKRKGIVAFRDDTILQKGKSISDELMQAIQASHVFIVVFSKNYATSTWCLDELTHILGTGRTTLPVFYDVSPSQVRKQSEDYGKAMAGHEERFKDDLELVQRWREALTHVASLSGFDIQHKPQYRETEKIVEEVNNMLGRKDLSLSNDLVGVYSGVKNLENLMALDSKEVRVVGISGMGGIGKTTLARVLYDKIYHQYDACCFIDDVSKIYEDYGPIGAQKQLLCQTLNEANQEIWNISKATYLIRTRLQHIRSLIVFDNVDQVEQLEILAGSREWLSAGSRILLISRDEHILKAHGVDEVYRVQPLNKDNALQLLCRKAFNCDVIMREYEELANMALSYAAGLPLAIKVLGSFLYGRDMSEWRSALASLKDNPKREIVDVLRISFDGLEKMEKEIFLDIACFFNHEYKTHMNKMLHYRGFNPDIGLRVLHDKSLITTDDGYIVMHSMLQELGWKIVQEKASNDPRKWSRLWRCKDYCKLMFENMAIENLEAVLMGSYSDTLRAEALSKMIRLRYLQIWGVNILGSLDYLSNELRYLRWDGYPFTYLPSNFEPDKLFELNLPRSNIKQLWKGIKTLHNLRVINLSYSKYLTKTPDFRSTPNLEELNLEGCIKLVEISSSIGVLKKLVELNLSNCTSLMSPPNSLFCLSSLEVLDIKGCSKLFNKQLLQKGSHTEHLKKLDISETTMQCQSVSSFHKRLMLPFHFFNPRRHKESVGLLFPPLLSFPCLREPDLSFPCLRELDLSFCNIFKIPDSIGSLHCLEKLTLGGNMFVTLPSSIMELPRLGYLNLLYCIELKYLFEDLSCNVLPIRREYSGNDVPGLYIFNCPKLVVLESLSSMAISWMLQILKVLQESSPPNEREVEFVIPGTQIPRWFNNQSVGDTIWVDASSFLHDSNWIGIAFCVAFVMHEHHHHLSCRKDMSHIDLTLHIDRSRSCTMSIPIEMVRDMVAFELDHLSVTYVSRENIICFMFDKNMDDIIKFRFSLRFRPTSALSPLEVKSCGLRWVLKKDLDLESKELNPLMTNNDLWIEPFSSQRSL